MAMNNFDVVYIDDEVCMTDIFSQFVKFKYQHWRACAFNDSMDLYNKIVSNEISAKVWIVDVMMPGRNGTQIAAALSEVVDPSTVVIGYTALDHHTLESKPEYKTGLRCFSRIINKQENFSNLLDLVDVWVKK